MKNNFRFAWVFFTVSYFERKIIEGKILPEFQAVCKVYLEKWRFVIFCEMQERKCRDSRLRK